MFGFINKIFIELLSACTVETFRESLASHFEGSMKCVSLNNQRYKTRPTLVNINFNETLFYPFTVIFNKCGKSCNAIDDPCARVCVSNKV